MKQSRSALTMLLNAFKSVYRQAYIKGIASAVVLTAGLAAGQANAATSLTEGILTKDTVVNGSGEGTDNKYQYLQVTGGKTVTVEEGVTLTIESGDATTTGNYVSGASTATLTGDGALVLNLDEATKGLLVGKSGSVTLGKIDIQKGTLKVSGDTATAVSAGLLKVGSGESFVSDADGRVARVELFTGNGIGAFDEGRNIELNGSGEIRVMNGSAAANATLKADELRINGGTILFSGSSNNAGTLTITAEGGAMTDGLIDVTSGNTVTFALSGGSWNQDSDTTPSFDFTDGTLNVAGTLNLQSAGKKAAVFDMTAEDLDIVSVSGATTGTLTGTDAVTSGKIAVSGASATATATLRLSEGNLNKILTDSDGADNHNDNAIGLTVNGNGIVEIVKDGVVHLDDADTYKFSGSSAGAGYIHIAQDGAVKADRIEMGKAIADKANNSFSGSVIAGELTLSSTDSGSVTDYLGDNAEGIEVSEKFTVTGAKAFTLDKKGTFDTGETYAGETGTVGLIDAEELTVGSGPMVVKGHWTTDGNIKVTDDNATANLYIGTENGTTGGYAYLDIGTDTLTLGKSGAVTIMGAADPANPDHDQSATLDVSDGKLVVSLTDATDEPTLKVLDHGRLIIDSENLEDLLVNTQSGADITVSGSAANAAGTIEAVGELELKFSQVSGSAAAGKLGLDGNGILQADDGITLTNSGSVASLNFEGTIETTHLTVNDEYALSQAGENSGGKATVENGKFTVSGNIDSVNDTIEFSGASSTLTLDGTGSVNATIALTGNSDGATLTVADGAWTMEGLTVTSGSATVGGNGSDAE